MFFHLPAGSDSTNRKRLFSLIYGVLLSIALTGLILAEVIVNPYELLLNV